MHIANTCLPHETKVQKNYINFKGGLNLSTGKILHLSLIEQISKCKLDNIYDSLTSKINTPDFIKTTAEGVSIFKKTHSFIDTLKYPFTDLPLDILNSIANKFNINSLKNSNILINHNNKNQQIAYERALRGLLQNGDSFIESICKKHNINPDEFIKVMCENACGGNFGKTKDGACKEIVEKFYQLFDENFSKSKAKYNTTHERTITRLVTGTTAAIMLGNDFYNKSIMNGKDDKTAKEELKERENKK